MAISTRLNTVFKLCRVICIYQSNLQESTYVETSNVANGKFAGFRMLTTRDIQKMMKELLTFQTKKYIYKHDPDILKYTHDGVSTELVFITHPQSFHHKYALNTGMDSGFRPAPTLLWDYTLYQENESLNVYACAEYKGKDTVWCEAPFFNTSTGSVCLGTTKIDPQDFGLDVNKLKTDIVKGFFDSAFTHAGTSRCTKTNFITLQQKLLNEEEFPKEELVPLQNPNLQEYFI